MSRRKRNWALAISCSPESSGMKVGKIHTEKSHQKAYKIEFLEMAFDYKEKIGVVCRATD